MELDLDFVLHLRIGALVNYRNLEVYKLAVRFLPVAAKISRAMPTGYGSFAEQLRRASLSISINIAEGSGKTTRPDQRRYYAISRGSAMECAAIIDACVVLGFVPDEEARLALEILDSVVRMLSRMILPADT